MSRFLADLTRRLRLVASRCIVRSVDDSKGVQTVQASLLAGETRELQRLQRYGFTSHPRPGTTEGVAIFLGANRDQGVVIADDDRSARHFPLEEGEVAVYSDEGDLVGLFRGHEIRIQALGGRIRLQAPEISVEGNFVGTGDAELAGDVSDGSGITLAQMRAIYDSHTHVETGSVTAPPVPLMGGGAPLPGMGGGGEGEGEGEVGEHTHDAADVVSGEFADARISESSVTQHEAAIDHGALANYDVAEHRTIDDDGTAPTDLWSANKIGTLLDNKAGVAHQHAASGIISGTFDDARVAESNVTQHEGAIDHDALANYDVGQHRTINDAGSGATDLWSASKISTELALKALLVHAHTAAEIIAGEFADARISESSVTQHEGAIDHDALANYDAAEHRTINDAGSGATELWSASKIGTELAGKADSSHTHAAGDITSGTLADGRVAESNVTQHEAAIDHGSIAGLADDDHTQYLIGASWCGGNASAYSGMGATLTTIPIEAEDHNTGEFTYSAANDDVTVNEDGVYRVSVSLAVTKTTSNGTTQTQFLLERDTGGGFATLARAACQIYVRVAGYTSAGSFTRLVSLSAGDKLRVSGRITSGSNADVAGQGYILSIERVGR